MSPHSKILNPYDSPCLTIEDLINQNESSRGGIKRSTYIGVLIALPFIMSIFKSSVITQLGDIAPYAALGLIALSIALICYAVALRHINLGYSPYWCFALFIPGVNLLVAARCLIFPEGYAQHRRLDSFAIIVVASLLFFAAVFVTAFVASISTAPY